LFRLEAQYSQRKEGEKKAGLWNTKGGSQLAYQGKCARKETRNKSPSGVSPCGRKGKVLRGKGGGDPTFGPWLVVRGFEARDHAMGRPAKS